VVVDLTEQKAAQRALAQAREEAEREAARTAAILGQLAEGVIVTDTAGGSPSSTRPRSGSTGWRSSA
jgi:hypothetical protein